MFRCYAVLNEIVVGGTVVAEWAISIFSGLAVFVSLITKDGMEVFAGRIRGRRSWRGWGGWRWAIEIKLIVITLSRWAVLDSVIRCYKRAVVVGRVIVVHCWEAILLFYIGIGFQQINLWRRAEVRSKRIIRRSWRAQLWNRVRSSWSILKNSSVCSINDSFISPCNSSSYRYSLLFFNKVLLNCIVFDFFNTCTLSIRTTTEALALIVLQTCLSSCSVWNLKLHPNW